MTDPERICKRSSGLAAELLRAGAEERPGDAGLQQTLAALGVSGAVMTTATAAGAVSAAGSAKLMSASAGGAASGGAAAVGGAATATKAISATLLVKWIGIGVVGGVSLAGAATVVSAPHPSAPLTTAHVAPLPAPTLSAPATPQPEATPVAEARPEPEPEPEPAPPSVVPPPRVVASAAPAGSEQVDVGAPLAAEVELVDRARALLAAGRTEAGLQLLLSYEREFPEARLLPEVLFLELESYERSGRSAEARRAAERLLSGFPKSPHASRARRLLFP
jgi:hypothetical protein